MRKINRIIILVSILMALGIADTHPSPPEIPEIQAIYGHEKISIAWDKAAENSIDPLTGYSDFEGYRLYRSTDGGITWGKSWNRIYDHSGNQVGWKPYSKYDLNEYSDSLHCIYKNAYYNSAEGELCLSAGISMSDFSADSLNILLEIINIQIDTVYFPVHIGDVNSDSIEVLLDIPGISIDTVYFPVNTGNISLDSVEVLLDVSGLEIDTVFIELNIEEFDLDSLNNFINILNVFGIDAVINEDSTTITMVDWFFAPNSESVFNIPDWEMISNSNSIINIPDWEMISNSNSIINIPDWEMIILPSSLIYIPRYIRELDVSEFDPMATWFNLGENSGIANTIVDTDVIDGVNYTYAITAYDMGMLTYSVEFTDEVVVDDTTTVTDGIFVSDTTWASSNPDKHLGIDGLGYPSFESPRLFESFTDFNANGICDNNEPFADIDLSDTNENGLCDENGDWNLRIDPVNVITIQAGYKASNITYPEDDPKNIFIVPDSANVGNGERLYKIVNEYDLSRSIIRFEIEAGLDPNSFGNSTIGSFATLNPALYAYEAISDSNYLPKSAYDVSAEDYSEDSLNTILGLPGVNFDSETGLVSIPEYKLEDFKLTYVSDPLFESQWTDWFDGIQFRFDNGPNNLDGNPLALVDIKKITYSDTTLSNLINVKMRYKNKNDLPLRPMFNYRIDFSSAIFDTAHQVTGNGCNALPDINTQLPFRVTNITTGRQVKVQHLDKGMESAKINYGELSAGGGCVPVCAQSQICIEQECISSTGYKNCMWEFDESLVLIDTVYTSNNLGGDDEKVYNLKIGIYWNQYFVLRSGLRISEMTPDTWLEMIWFPTSTYDSQDVVIYEGMLYQATEDVSISNAPDEWFDNDGDDINDSPWQMLYPSIVSII